jgi:hypothetical protein
MIRRIKQIVSSRNLMQYMNNNAKRQQAAERERERERETLCIKKRINYRLHYDILVLEYESILQVIEGVTTITANNKDIEFKNEVRMANQGYPYLRKYMKAVLVINDKLYHRSNATKRLNSF